jgi:arabinofuranosyltransferase
MHSFARSGFGTLPALKGHRWAWLAFALATTLAIVHVAWICDDAFISARVVDNFLSFHGLRWNSAERVQAYTHPLWLLLMILARYVGRDAYWSLLALSVLTSAACVGMIAYRSPRVAPFLAAIAGTLALSKSFVEFSSSGLENPLTHLLVVLLWVEAVRSPSPSPFRVSALAGLAALNRLDLLLLFIPPLLAALRAQPRVSLRDWRCVVLACSPLLAWELFSLVYYGSLVPNTAIAKLETGVSRAELLGHGLAYVLQPSWNDPVSLVLLLVGLPLGMVRGRGPLRALCLGATLYICYVIWIGGDFMAGRFLSAPVLVAVLTLIELAPIPRPALQVALSAGALALQAVSPTPIWAAPLPASSFVEAPSASTCLDGVCDERAFYGPFTSWRRTLSAPLKPAHPWSLRGVTWSNTPDRTRIAGAIGFRGFFAGPKVFIVDYFGLSDPLIARLPHDPKLHSWKPGHLKRCVPLGYPEAARLGPNSLTDAPLRDYYQRIWLVTRGALWSSDRWRAIWQLNTSASRFNQPYTCRPPAPVDPSLP